MTENPISPTNPESNSDASNSACSTVCEHCGGGFVRAVLYTPVVLGLGALAALATFPELAEYAKPLMSHSSSGSGCAFKCPMSSSKDTTVIASSYSYSAGASCCASKQRGAALGACCQMDDEACPSASESAVNSDLTAVDSATLTEDAPADATLAINVIDPDTPSN